MGPLCQSVKIYLLHQANQVSKLYRNIYGCNYKPNIGIDNPKIAGARELPRYLSVPKLCQFL